MIIGPWAFSTYGLFRISLVPAFPPKLTSRGPQGSPPTSSNQHCRPSWRVAVKLLTNMPKLPVLASKLQFALLPSSRCCCCCCCCCRSKYFQVPISCLLRSFMKEAEKEISSNPHFLRNLEKNKVVQKSGDKHVAAAFFRRLASISFC